MSNALERLLTARHHDPFAILGLHPDPAGWVLRVFRPDASKVTLLLPQGGAELARTDERGLFEWRGSLAPIRPWRLAIEAGGQRFEITDPYAFGPCCQIRKCTCSTKANCWKPGAAWAAQRAGGRRRWRALRRLGAQCRTRERGGRLQQLGWPRPRHARARRFRHLGTVHPRPGCRRSLQVRDSQPRHRRRAGQGRSRTRAQFEMRPATPP
jgi:hypothetical protein